MRMSGFDSAVRIDHASRQWVNVAKPSKQVADATVIRASDEAKVGNPALSPVVTREFALA